MTLALPLPGRLTAVSFTPQPGVTFDEWAEAVRVMGRLIRVTPWIVGDLLAYGEDHFGERAAQVFDEFGLASETISNYVNVARAIPRTRRRKTLPFSIHAEVAALPEREQEEWLTRCEAKGWTRGQLREARGQTRRALTDSCAHVCQKCGARFGG